jgi:hypothetical protein
MGTWVDRYDAGSRVEVWTDMIGLGDALRSDPDGWAEATAVAARTMQRARRNVETLIERLTLDGYEFDPGGGLRTFEPPQSDASDRIDELEAVVGPLPLALRAWCEQVGSVSLLGRHPGVHLECADPLVVQVPLAHVQAEFVQWQADQGTEWSDGSGFAVDIAPDRLHKAGISGGPPYGLAIPNAAADVLLLWEPHQTTFTNYLRVAFAAGGFPGLDHVGHGHEPMTGPAARGPIGLLPI